jgi:pimeloyl-ACP methyl ester carboxylesterase
MLWRERGGRGEHRYLLLHGLGATGAVWRDGCRELDNRGEGEWLVIDLPGHGGSSALSKYSIGALASPSRRRWNRIGRIGSSATRSAHTSGSRSRAAGLACASPLSLGSGRRSNGARPTLVATAEFARKPVRVFPDEAEAWSRYRKVSGLDVRRRAGPALLARGVAAADSGFRLANDPQTVLVAGAPFATLAASARCPVLLARGASDPMVTLDQLRAHCATAIEIPGTGHNAHVETPGSIVALSERLASESR